VNLPISQYPEISPPTVTITTRYPGASADTLASTVAAPIEEQLSGAEGMIYFASSASSDGTLTITGDLRGRHRRGPRRLPAEQPRAGRDAAPADEVRRNGVVVQKRSNDILLVIALTSPGNRMPTTGARRLRGGEHRRRDEAHQRRGRRLRLRRRLVDAGMAQPRPHGAPGGDPHRTSRTPSAPRTRSTPAGKVGAEPAPPGQSVTYTVTVRGRLARVEEFENIVVRASGPNGVLRIKDVATVGLDALNYDTSPRVNGQKSVGMAVFLQSGANALAVSDAIKARMVEMKPAFPEDMTYLIPFDTTLVVKASIREVQITIFEAALLVLAVVFLFLQSWRATIIPMLAVPVSIIGTFAGLYALGFSINTLTLFAMVLAIGIVVDDAIVVLENVERLMRDHGMGAKQASIEAMHEVSGALDRHHPGAVRGVHSRSPSSAASPGSSTSSSP
jgi:HAE1 family hydrophobic/amphiphilic exporter-1/multidrug efflux pump